MTHAAPFTPQDLSLIQPQTILAAAAVAVMLLDLLITGKDRLQTAILSFAAVAAAAWFSLSQWGVSASAFGGLIVVDNFSTFLNLIFLSAAALTIVVSVQYNRNEDINSGEYYILILTATLGMMVMASAGSLLTVFLGIETLSISLYVLAGINHRNRAGSGESALKYLLLGAFASGFLLYGIAMLYGAAGSLMLAKVAAAAGGTPAPLFYVGAALVFIGAAFKASLVPFHFWAPDVYQGAPTPVSGFMATGGKAAAFAVLARLLMTAIPGIRENWEPVVWAIAILSMTVANVTALQQNNVKRMLAFSSVAHAGYLLIAVLAGGKIGGPALLFYLASYTLMNIGAFGVIGALAGKNRAPETLPELAGIGFKKPLLAAAMTWFLLSLAGIPTTAGFLAKLYVFSSGVRADLLPLVIVGVINAVISAYYYLRVIVFMYMTEPEEEIEFAPVSFLTFAALLVCAAGVLALGVYPDCVLNAVQKAIL